MGTLTPNITIRSSDRHYCSLDGGNHDEDLARMAKEIRFVVGSRGDVRSSVWRLWAGSKNNLYLAARTTAGISKISFHDSGVYRFAVVSTEPRAALHKWQRPKETDSGVTPIFDVVVPAFTVAAPICDLPPSEKPVVFLSPPNAGSKIIIRILLTNPAVTELELRKLTRGKTVLFHGCVTLQSENAWIVSYDDNLKASEYEFVANLVRETRLHMKGGAQRSDVYFAYLHSLEASNIPPAIVDIQLGLGNVDVPEAPQ